MSTGFTLSPHISPLGGYDLSTSLSRMATMPLEFLTRIANAHLPVVVARPSDMAALQKCVAAGYLEIAPLTVKTGPNSAVFAARVTAVLPEGREALRCLRDNAKHSDFQKLS